jgi:AcrR family transcriptional regulator
VESQDDLWPPWSPAAAHRAGRRGGPQPGGPRPGPPPRGSWGQGAPPRRARAGAALSRGEIVDAAIAVADAEGPDAVSMRRIAQVLRAGTMSLYWHVASKEHLIDLMLEELVSEVDVPDPSGDWRADLRAYARSHRASLLRHRWVIDYIGARPGLGPSTLRIAERSLALLAGLSLDAATIMNIVQTVNTYVMGAVLREFQELRVQASQERLQAELEASGVSISEIRADFAAWRERLRARGGFEHFVEVFDQGVDPDSPATRDERFNFGLDCLLAGIAATVAGGAHPG